MPPRPPGRANLAKLMDDRRIELGLTWEQVADAAGLRYETLRAVRNKDSAIRPLTRRAIATALRWSPNSVDLILDGGDPDPLPEQAAAQAGPRPQDPPAPAAEPEPLPGSEDAALGLAVARLFIQRVPPGTERAKFDALLALAPIYPPREVLALLRAVLEAPARDGEPRGEEADGGELPRRRRGQAGLPSPGARGRHCPAARR